MVLFFKPFHFLEVIERLVDLLHCIDNVVYVAFDIQRPVVILIDSGVQIQLSVGFVHEVLNVFSLLAYEHGTLIFWNENGKTQLFILGVLLHVFDQKMVDHFSGGLKASDFV